VVRRLSELLRIFEDRDLRAVALFGSTYAQKLAGEVKEVRSDLEIFKEYHSSDRGVNSNEKRQHFKETFRKIKDFLDR
jgi:hypothetical protein